MSALDLLTDVLAATRLTRLVVEDSFPPVQRVRDRFVDAHSVDQEVRSGAGAEPATFADEFSLSLEEAEALDRNTKGGLTTLTAGIQTGRLVVVYGEDEGFPFARVLPVETAGAPIEGQQESAHAVLTKGQVIGHTKVYDSWAELVTCPWCSGMWVSLGVVLARLIAPRLWDPLAKALAASMAVGLVESKVDVE